jgi:hypothetical protein
MHEIDGRWSIRRDVMKILVAALVSALALATLIAAPAIAAAPYDRGDSAQSSQSSNGGTYKGYPLSDWYRPDGY